LWREIYARARACNQLSRVFVESVGGEMAATLHTCDLCPKAVFHSRQALLAHIDERHGSFVPDRDEIAKLAAMIQPQRDALVDALGEKWTAVGGRTFAVASSRDAGPARLKQACDARAQLELVARRWRASAEVYVFGSSVAMGVWDGLSDIDCTVVDVAAMDAGEWPPNEKAAVRNLATLFRNVGFTFQNLEPIEHARVPIIKHNASLPAIKVLGEEYQRLLSRSIRCLFTRPQKPDERQQFESDLARAVHVTPEAFWWDPGYRTCGSTLPDATTAVAALLHIAGTNTDVSAAPLHTEFRPDVFHVDFDLSFRTFGIRNSILLRSLLTAHTCGRPGALVLKDWSKLSGVNNSINGFLTSYAVNIMWIYYLVQKGHVPYIDPQSIPVSLKDTAHAKDPQYKPLIPSDVAASDEAKSRLEMDMGRLLFGFFAFYCYEFNWDAHVVTLNRPGVTTKAQLGWTEDDEVRLSKKNTRYIMCIEDPYEENLNLGRHLGENRARKVMSELQRGLVSMVRDSVEDMSIFPARKPPIEPGKEPRLSDVTKLLATAATTAGTYTVEEFRSTFESKCPDALERVLQHWSWVETVRRLGYKEVAGHVFPVRAVANRRPLQPTCLPERPDKPPVDTADRLIAEFMSERAKKEHLPAPEWMMWQPPNIPLPPPGRVTKTSGRVLVDAVTRGRWSLNSMLRLVV
jgi:hypothetical protein